VELTKEQLEGKGTQRTKFTIQVAQKMKRERERRIRINIQSTTTDLILTEERDLEVVHLLEMKMIKN